MERPDYRVDIRVRRNHVRAQVEGLQLAETDAPLLVDEQDHALVFYFPRSDVLMDALRPTDTSTYCPFKGHASYWRLADDGSDLGDIAWSYESPYAEVARLAGCIAFYQDKVTVEVGAGPLSIKR